MPADRQLATLPSTPVSCGGSRGWDDVEVGAAGRRPLLAVGTAGCWPQPGGGPSGSNHNSVENVLNVATVGQLEP